MSECTHDCSTCGANCGSREQPQSLLEKPHAGTNIKKVIAVMSGKGGVGKSMVTACWPCWPSGRATRPPSWTPT